MELLLTDRLEESSLDEVAARAGHTDGAIGTYFPTKAHLSAAALDVVYGQVIQRVRAVPIRTVDQLVMVVSSWSFQATTHTGWVRAEYTLGRSEVERAIGLRELATALGGWLAEAAEHIGARDIDGENTAAQLITVLAGLATLYPEPADLTIPVLRRHVAWVLSEIIAPQRPRTGRPRDTPP